MGDTSRGLELCLIDPRRLDDDQLIALHGIELPSHPNRAPQYTCRAQCPRRSPMTRLKALSHFRTDRHSLCWQQHVRVEAKLGRFTTATVHSQSYSHSHSNGQGIKTGQDGVVKGSKAKRSETSTSTPGHHVRHGRGRRMSAPAACTTSSPSTSRGTSFFDHAVASSPLAKARSSFRQPPHSTFATSTPDFGPRRPSCPPTFNHTDDDDYDNDDCDSPNIDQGPTPPETLATTEAYRHWSVVLGLASHEPPFDSWVGPPRGASGGHELFQSWGWHVQDLDAVKQRRTREEEDAKTSTGTKRPLEVIPEGRTIGDGDRPFKRPRGRPRKHPFERNTTLTPSNRQYREQSSERRVSWGRHASDSGYESNLENEDYKRTPCHAQANSKLIVSPDVVHGALMGLVMMSKR